MTTQPQTLPDNMLLDDLKPARFLKPYDLTDRWKVAQLVITIAKITLEETEPKPGEKELQPVLYFKTKSGETFPRGLLLGAKVNVQNLKAATGAKTLGETTGKKIRIILDTHRGKSVLRIDLSQSHHRTKRRSSKN